MLGFLLSKIRTDKHMSKTKLSELTNINIGHLSHIEKGERIPSHKALKEISKALDIPYKNLMNAYDHDLSDEQKKYGAANHVLYNKIPIFGSFLGFTKCDLDTSNADFAIFINDESMSPKFALGSYVLVEQNAPLSNRDYGVFMYEDKVLIRRFIIRKNDLVLRAEDPNISEIVLLISDDFYVIGKVLLPKIFLYFICIIFMEVYMNLIDGIIFNTNELKQNSFVKITYTGSLNNSNSSKIFAHIGFGSNWQNIMDLEMQKCCLGYELTLQLPSQFDSINMAFMNDKNEWDNNFGNDFSFKLIPIKATELVPVTESALNCVALQKSNRNFRKFKLFCMKISKFLPRLLFNHYSFDTNFNN